MNYFDTAVKAANLAGQYLVENLGKVREIGLKAKNDLVTDIDLFSEKLIVDTISAEFPDHSILAEEGGMRENGSEYKWLIDPLDGTMNYAHTYPFFSVSISLEENGRPVLGVVYDPVRDEMFSAELGQGACLNGAQIKPSVTENLEDSLLATGFLHKDESIVEQNLKHFSDFIWKARGVRRDGSAALDLCYVACGRYDGFWELGLHPWDMAAGAFIIEESGGNVTNISGGEFTTYKGDIAATNGLIHNQLLNLLSLR